MYYNDRTLGSGGGASQGEVLNITPTTTPTKPNGTQAVQTAECFSYGLFTVGIVVAFAVGKVLFTRN